MLERLIKKIRAHNTGEKASPERKSLGWPILLVVLSIALTHIHCYARKVASGLSLPILKVLIVNSINSFDVNNK